eukprot:m.933224 g.933224  ORF g.933224 m.933224 type:complete len:109 (-) comp23795_c0_seq28:200-526(-)
MEWGKSWTFLDAIITHYVRWWWMYCQVPTVVVADYIPAVLELNVSPAARLRSEAVLDSVRSVVEEYLREQNVVADEARVGAQHVEEGGGRSDDENRSSDGDTSDGDQH